MLWNKSLGSTCLLKSLGGLPSQALIVRRTAIIPSKKGSIRRKRKRVKDVSFSDLDLQSIDPNDHNAMEFKVKQLQEFTRNLREHIKVADSSIKKHEAQKELSDLQNTGSSEAGDADVVYRELTSTSAPPLPTRASSEDDENVNLSSLILASEARSASKLIPDIIRERIKDDKAVLSALLDSSHQDWNVILSKLYESKLRLKGISRTTLQKRLLNNFDGLNLESIEKLDEMLIERLEGDFNKFSTPMYECIFFNLAKLKPTSLLAQDAVIDKMKQLLKRFDCSQEAMGSAKMTQFILNSCIKYSSKTRNLNNMNFFLTKFKDDYRLSPNRENYTTIIQFCTKIGVSKQAWDVFDTMKFLSQSHSPDVVTYNSVLHLCNKDKDYAKAIDIYQEMVDKKIEPSVETLNIMAKTMARASSDPVTSENKQDSLRLLGWRYIHMIESKLHNKQSDDRMYHTLNSMMALAAYDGDVALSRALYFKYCMQRFKEVTEKFGGRMDKRMIWRRVLDAELFNYLLLSYANHSSDKLPILLGYEQGIKFRRNILNSVDYSGRGSNDDGLHFRLPMLPIIDLDHPSQILFESRALWHFNLEFGGISDLRTLPEGLTIDHVKELAAKSPTVEEFKFRFMQEVSQWKSTLVNHSVLNTISLTSFLTIPIKAGDKNEFNLRLKEFSFQKHVFDDCAERLYDSTLNPKADLGQNEMSKDVSTENQLQNDLAFLSSMKHKILCTCATYELMMKAAAAFNDIELATKAWKDRGEFRRTVAFGKLDEKERIKWDAKFATLMVQFFASQKLFADALGIIMTSKRYINWQYPMVRNLHKGLVEIEDEKSIRTLLDVVNKKSSLQIMEEEMQELKL